MIAVARLAPSRRTFSCRHVIFSTLFVASAVTAFAHASGQAFATPRQTALTKVFSDGQRHRHLREWKPHEIVECQVAVIGGSLAATSAALTSAREGARTCLFEPSDWPGGQMTMGGVPAIDFAWHKVESTDGFTIDVREIARPVRNQAPEFLNWLLALGNPGNCWVSRHCFQPMQILESGLWPALREAGKKHGLQVFLNTVLRDVETEQLKEVTAEQLKGPLSQLPAHHRRITALYGVTRSERNPAQSGLAERAFSADVPLWYADGDEGIYDRRNLQVIPPPGKQLVVVDASESGDALVLSGAPFLQGVETAEGVPETADSTCGQMMTYPFVLEHTAQKSPDSVRYEWLETVPQASRDFFTLKQFSVDQVWSYRRIFDSGSLTGSLSLQNWGEGNDYPFGYAFISTEAARAAAESGNWQGGWNTAALAAAEDHARAYARWFADRAAEADTNLTAEQFRLRGDVLGTRHGLSRMPYLRDTRRSVGLGSDGQPWILSVPEALPQVSAPIRARKSVTGTRFRDRVTTGVYAVDIHFMRSCAYPNHVEDSLRPLPFYIPSRSLTNYGVDNMLVAGKSLAQSFLMNAATRLHPIEWKTGVAAGASAAWIAERAGRTSADLEGHSRALRRRIKRHAPVRWHIPRHAVYPTKSDSGH